jgi:hypothetical protein
VEFNMTEVTETMGENKNLMVFIHHFEDKLNDKENTKVITNFEFNVTNKQL